MGREGALKSGTRRNRRSNSLLRFYRPVPRPDNVVRRTAKEKHKRGNRKEKRRGRPNELNRRKKKFSRSSAPLPREPVERFLLQFYDLNRPRSADILFDFASPAANRERRESAVDFTLYFYDIPTHATDQLFLLSATRSRVAILGSLSRCPTRFLQTVCAMLSRKRTISSSPPIQRLLSDPDDSILPPSPRASSLARVRDGRELRANTFNPFLLLSRKMHSMTIRGAFRLARGEPRAMIRTA